jgi:hypothetical protein
MRRREVDTHLNSNKADIRHNREDIHLNSREAISSREVTLSRVRLILSTCSNKHRQKRNPRRTTCWVVSAWELVFNS